MGDSSFRELGRFFESKNGKYPFVPPPFPTIDEFGKVAQQWGP